MVELNKLTGWNHSPVQHKTISYYSELRVKRVTINSVKLNFSWNCHLIMLHYNLDINQKSMQLLNVTGAWSKKRYVAK